MSVPILHVHSLRLLSLLSFFKWHDLFFKLILTFNKIKLAIYQVNLCFHLDAQFTQTVFYVWLFYASSSINYDWPSLLTALCTAVECVSSVLLLIEVNRTNALNCALPGSRVMKGTIWAWEFPVAHEDVWEVLLFSFLSVQDANGSGVNGPCKWLDQQWHVSAELDS